MRGGILLVLAFWAIAGLFAYVQTRDKSRDATATALYIVTYPALGALLYASKPAPMVLVVPFIMAGIPWLLAGAHLSKVLNDPSATRPREFVGLPLSYWGWGSLLSLGVALVFQR